MKFIDFFAGIGGFRKGMELAGHKCVGFCEFDKYATASYTSMHLITEEQRDYLSNFPLKRKQKEIFICLNLARISYYTNLTFIKILGKHLYQM